MIFKTDKQTTDDLLIFGKVKDRSIYGIFNKTCTTGGAKILEEMFSFPLSKIEEIKKRSQAIAFFAKEKITFPFKGSLFDAIEDYISEVDSRSRLSIHEDNLERKLKSVLGADTQFERIKRGVVATLQFLEELSSFIMLLESKNFEQESGCSFSSLKKNMTEKEFPEILEIKNTNKLSDNELIKLDQSFRFKNNEIIKALTIEIYQLDVLIAAAKVGRENGFSLALPFADNKTRLKIIDGFHPLLKNAIPNSLEVSNTNNMIFLTGANMAGKSTFMKMTGIAVYLAHMGFPVPAAKMEFSVLNGMYTTINLPDNINMGYSHFYAEVLRVKKVAKAVSSHGNIMVIFDELFRGTNVKDAYEATVAVAEAFAGIKKSVFVISSHIIEAGENLSNRIDNISFINLPTYMDGKKPRYTYKIEKGISNDRHGMLIIKNEGIPQMLGYEETPSGSIKGKKFGGI